MSAESFPFPSKTVPTFVWSHRYSVLKLLLNSITPRDIFPVRPGRFALAFGPIILDGNIIVPVIKNEKQCDNINI